MTLRAAIYARISQKDADRDKAQGQVDDLMAFAEAEGYEVVSTFVDDGLSAYKGVERPAWTELLVAIADGEYGVVLATEEERFARGAGNDKRDLQAACVESGTVWHTIRDGKVDPSTDAGGFMADVRDAFARLEVARKTARQQATIKRQLADGLPLWGQRPFGFEVDRLTERTEEADAIRQAYADVLAGATLHSVARAWNAAGLRTARAGVTMKGRAASGLWTTNTVRQVLQRPSIAGRLVSKGTVLKDDLPAIVTPEEFDIMQAYLADPARKPKRGPVTAHLLTGLLTCTCGRTMTRGTVSSRGYSYTVYRCRDASTPGSGRHAYIRQPVADDAVIREVFLWTAIQRSREVEVTSPRLGKLLLQVAEVKRKRGVVQTLATMEGADLKQVARDLADLGKELAALEVHVTAERAAQAGASLLGQISTEWFDGAGAGGEADEAMEANYADFRSFWDALPIDRRREVVQSALTAQLLAKDDPRVDPEAPESRVLVEWRG